MEGPKIVIAWKQWRDSEEGRKASDPYTLGSTNGARQYLENRLQRAFYEGIRVAENALLLQLNARHSKPAAKDGGS